MRKTGTIMAVVRTPANSDEILDFLSDVDVGNAKLVPDI